MWEQHKSWDMARREGWEKKDSGIMVFHWEVPQWFGDSSLCDVWPHRIKPFITRSDVFQQYFWIRLYYLLKIGSEKGWINVNSRDDSKIKYTELQHAQVISTSNRACQMPFFDACDKWNPIYVVESEEFDVI